MAEPKAGSTIRQIANAAPAVGFLATLLITRGDFRKATWVLMGLTVVALAVSLIVDRRISPILAFSGAMAFVFGGLSLALHRNDLLQMKMTVVDGILGAVLFGGLLLKRNPMKLVLGAAVTLPDKAWRVLTIRYAVFFWACAIANEVVRRTQTPEVWATFRVVAFVAIVVFGAAQFPLLRKYGGDDRAARAAEPPEPGF